MSDEGRQKLEKRLLEERDRAQEALENVDEAARTGTLDDGALTQYSQHQADHGTDTYEQEQQLLLMSKETEILNQVNEALQRLYKEPEKFGVCERCGQDISMERLEIVPWATHCSKCQNDKEGSRE